MLEIAQRYWQRRSRRDQAIARSVLSALGAKGCGILLQIFAIPYTIRILGLEVYGNYAIAAALFAWGSMLEVGLGTSMIRGMVAAISRNDAESTTSYFATGFIVVASLVVGVGLLIAGAFIFGVTAGVSIPQSFDLRLVFCAGGLAALQIVTATVTRARAAFQETHINNLYGAAANLTAAVLLWLLVKPGATALSILLILNGPLLFAQICNGLFLLQKPLLNARWHLSWNHGWLMIQEGSWLTFGQTGVFLEREAPKLVIALTATVVAVGEYACAIQLLVIMAGIIVMISGPLMPAITEAMLLGEHRWWWRRVIFLEFVIFVLGTFGIGLMGIYGPRLFSLLFGHRVNFASSDCAGLTCWTIVILGSHTLYTVLLAGGRVRSVALWQICQGCLVLLVFVTFYDHVGLGGFFWLASAVTLVTTFLPWFGMARKLSRQSEVCVRSTNVKIGF